MDVFDDIYSSVKSAADLAGRKTGEIIELTKLRMSAADLQTKINKEYQELGLLVYNAARDHTDCTEQVKEKAAGIDEVYARLAEVQEKITELKKLKKCPECGYGNAEEALYCQKCGAKL